jgi:hypothetical protein
MGNAMPDNTPQTSSSIQQGVDYLGGQTMSAAAFPKSSTAIGVFCLGTDTLARLEKMCSLIWTFDWDCGGYTIPYNYLKSVLRDPEKNILFGTLGG